VSDTLHLRTAVLGLIGFAALEEELLLAGASRSEPEQGSPACWAARPIIAHNAEFKRQQAQRLEAVQRGEVPPAFAEIQHASEEVYERYAEPNSPTEIVLAASREATHALMDGLAATSDEDLLDPARNPWLTGRKLWLQIVVRGFWHPTGHVGEYYLAHSQPERAVALQEQAVAVCVYLGAPDQARGMACYNLACAAARSGRPEKAVKALEEAVRLNPALRAHASRDADLEHLREDGRLDALLDGE